MIICMFFMQNYFLVNNTILLLDELFGVKNVIIY